MPSQRQNTKSYFMWFWFKHPSSSAECDEGNRFYLVFLYMNVNNIPTFYERGLIEIYITHKHRSTPHDLNKSQICVE